MISEETVYTLLGSLGAALVLFGFYRTSVGRWTNKTLWYELDNLIGPLLIIIYSIHHHAYVGTVLNFVWVVVAFRGLLPFAERYGRRLRHKSSRSKRRAAR